MLLKNITCASGILRTSKWTQFTFIVLFQFRKCFRLLMAFWEVRALISYKENCNFDSFSHIYIQYARLPSAHRRRIILKNRCLWRRRRRHRRQLQQCKTVSAYLNAILPFSRYGLWHFAMCAASIMPVSAYLVCTFARYSVLYDIFRFLLKETTTTDTTKR